MSKRQKRFLILFYIIGLAYVLITNFYTLGVVKLTIGADNIPLFLSLWLLFIALVLAHSIAFGGWMATFTSNFIEGDEYTIFSRFKDKNFMKGRSKRFIKFRNWVNEIE